MEKQMCGETGFQLAVRPTDSQLSLRSSLSYKYNPTVQYSVVLYRDMESTFGELRVSFRTQNRELLNLLTDLFRIWSNMENTYIAHLFPGERGGL